MLKLFIINILIFFATNTFAISKIYLIRHAEVKIENPGWCNSKTATNYRKLYNNTSIENFNPKTVLDKIENYKSIDTVFCSSQLRALETAELLFNKKVILNIDDNLRELNYSVLKWSIIRLSVKMWLTFSLVAWIAGNNKDVDLSYKQKKRNLKIYSKKIINYAETHGESVVVAHGMLNRELIKILKKQGWRLENKDGLGNLSVNCLVKNC